ncbi:MAG: hypothetical protein QNJ70_12895 [Xenococcaceae cyanobacterium MO_207.B15]|nr:hypothetical protein [Xenococcaceae cyanobacterium MO_207.B15]
MKTRARIPAKVVSKPPQKPIQTTLERHSISRDVSENLKTKTGESNSKLSSFNLNAIALSSKKTATISPNISDRNIQSQFKTIQPPKNAGVNTIRPKQQHPVIENISSSPQQIQQISGSLGKIGGAISSGAKNLGGAISSGAKNLVGGVTDFFTEQFNSGKGDAERILKNAEREANRVIRAGEAEAKKIMGDTSVSTSQSRTGGGFLSKIKTAIRSLKVPHIFAKLENNAITPTGGSLIQGFFGKISKAIKRAVSRASKGKITFNSGGRYNARGRAKAVAERAKSKARRVAALARLRAKRFLRHRESIAKYLVNSAKTRAKRINQDAKSRSQRMMQRGEYTAAKSLLYKEKRRARLLVYRNNRYARTILNKAQPIANRIIAKGKIRAERIIAWGERKADRIIQDGQRRADNVIRQAQQRAERIREQGKRDADAAIRRRKKNVFQKLAGWIGDGIRGLANAVGNFIKAAGNFLGKIARGAVDFLKAVGRGIQSLGNALINGAKRAWNAAKQVLKKAAEVVVAIVKEAVKVVKEIAQTIIDVIAAPFKVLYQLIQLMRQIGGKVASVAGKIAKNPLKFGETLINGGKAGFNRFTSQFPQHLENGIQGYLFGETNIKLPSFDAKGIITMLLQTVGLSRDSVREMAVAKLGEEKVAFAEGFSEAASEGKMGEFAQEQAQTYASNVANQVGNQTQLPLLAKLFTALSKGGQGIINFFKELNLSELIKTIVIDGIKNFLIETIQNKAIPYAMAKLAASATPIVGWIMAAIDGLKMANEIFVKRAQQVKALVDSLGDAVVNAASYAEGGVASQLEAGMKKAIPILMSALASYANIGDIPSKIKGVIDKGKNWVNENIKPYINKVIDTVGSLIPDLSGKQLATRITKGLGIGNVYDKIRNYLKPHTQKPFETFNDAKKVVDTAQTVFKPLGINSLNLEQADKTGHSFNVIAAKPLPGRKPVINANPIRISRKPNITNNINSKRVMQFPKPNNIISPNSISTIQTNSLSLSAKQSSSKLYSTTVKSKPIVSNFIRQKSPLISKAVATRLPNLQKQSETEVAQFTTKEQSSTYSSIPGEYKYSVEFAKKGKFTFKGSIVIKRKGDSKFKISLGKNAGKEAKFKLSAALGKIQLGEEISWLKIEFKPMEIALEEEKYSPDIVLGAKVSLSGVEGTKILFPTIDINQYDVTVDLDVEFKIPAHEAAELVKRKKSNYFRKRANKEITKLNNEVKTLKTKANNLRRQLNKTNRKGLQKKLNPEIKQVEKQIQTITNTLKESDKLEKSIQKKAIKSFAGKMALKTLARVAIKAIPVIGWASTVYDIVELIKFLDKKAIPAIEKMIDDIQNSEDYQTFRKVFIEQDTDYVIWFMNWFRRY